MAIQVPGKDKGRMEALQAAIQQIEKQHGKGAVMFLGGEQRFQVEGVSSGSLALDLALGGRGLPRGRTIEVFGPEGSGKTTLCLTVIRNIQKEGGMAAYVDAEHALDPSWAEKIGVNTKELLLSQPDSGEQGLQITEDLIRSGAVDLVVVDSVAALVPKAELEGEMGDAVVGLQARLMSQAMRKLGGIVSKSRAMVLFINQIREKIGIMFGNPETTPGGRALKFWASVRIDIRKIGNLKDGENTIGSRVRMHVVKNKVAPPFKKAESDLMFDGGLSREGDILDLGESSGVLARSGSWFLFGGERIGQGREQARVYLKTNLAAAAKIETAIRRHLGLLPPEAPAAAAPEEESEAKKAREKDARETKDGKKSQHASAH